MAKEIKTYTEEDIKNAFDMGIETALIIFEKSIGLSEKDQRNMLDKLRQEIDEDELLSEIASSQQIFL